MLSSPHQRTPALALLLGTMQVVHPGQPNRSPEYELKARVLRTLGGYVTWPAGSTRPADVPFVIGILGDSPFERFLDQQVMGKMAHNRRITVSYLRTLHPSAILGCDILFICDSEYDRVMDILRICKGRPILTVGDSAGFCGRGVIINMIVTTEKIAFEVNARAAREAGLEISSTILSSPNTRIFNAP